MGASLIEADVLDGVPETENSTCLSSGKPTGDRSPGQVTTIVACHKNPLQII